MKTDLQRAWFHRRVKDDPEFEDRAKVRVEDYSKKAEKIRRKAAATAQKIYESSDLTSPNETRARLSRITAPARPGLKRRGMIIGIREEQQFDLSILASVSLLLLTSEFQDAEVDA
jgi:vacuolar-type H+-ATPase subunit H